MSSSFGGHEQQQHEQQQHYQQQQQQEEDEFEFGYAMDRETLKQQISNMHYQAKMERWPLSKSIEA